MRHLTLAISFIGFVFLSFFQLSAQNLELFNEINLDPHLIKKYGIKSLSITCDRSLDSSTSSSAFPLPSLMEFSFNKEGLKTFMKTDYFPDLLTRRGAIKGKTKLEWFEYDSLQRTIQTRINHGRNIQENTYTFDSANNVTKKVLSYEGVVNTTEIFEWENGKLTDSQMTSNSSWIHTYGSDGRLCRMESGTHLTETVSNRYLNILDRSVISYRSGKMVANGRTMKDVFNDRLFYMHSLDGNLDSVYLINAKFDEHSNIIYYFHKDFPWNSERIDKRYPRPFNEALSKEIAERRNPVSWPRLTIFEIENTYDDRGLLIEQKYIQIDPMDRTKKKTISIRRLTYSTAELPTSSFSTEK